MQQIKSLNIDASMFEETFDSAINSDIPFEKTTTKASKNMALDDTILPETSKLLESLVSICADGLSSDSTVAYLLSANSTNTASIESNSALTLPSKLAPKKASTINQKRLFSFSNVRRSPRLNKKPN